MNLFYVVVIGKATPKWSTFLATIALRYHLYPFRRGGKEPKSNFTSFANNIVTGIIFIQSLDLVYGIPKYLIKIFSNLKFETFHVVVKCFVSSYSYLIYESYLQVRFMVNQGVRNLYDFLNSAKPVCQSH